MTPAQAQSAVDTWNRKHKIGTPVIRYRLINPPRDGVLTVTRSLAWVDSGVAKVSVEGIEGGVPLEGVVAA